MLIIFTLCSVLSVLFRCGTVKHIDFRMTNLNISLLRIPELEDDLPEALRVTEVARGRQRRPAGHRARGGTAPRILRRPAKPGHLLGALEEEIALTC